MVPTENATNQDYKEIKQEADTTRSLINRIHKRQAIFFSHGMRSNEKIEHLVTIRMTERKRSSGKLQENMLDGQTKWLNVG